MASVFDVTTSGPSASDYAKGYMLETNQSFEANRDAVYDGIQRFWYRNKDEEGNGVLEGDEPSGIEILQAMGVNASAFLACAYARVVMLVTIATQLGKPDLIDVTKCSGPYDFTFNPDGSLKTWTLKN
jgi:hypothetical protein